MAGGYRAGAGRKSSWCRPTKMIRLPAEFEAELIEAAHKLDCNPSRLISLDELTFAMAAVLLSMPPPQRKRANRLFKKLRQRLDQ